MKRQNGFEPQEVLGWFEEISAIPRGSEKEEKIAAYLMDFARKRGLCATCDSWNNVLIRKAAAAGYENCPTVIIQGHSDMVCEREAGVAHDFETEGLDLYVEDGLLRARGTTLGADNGIALALGLALLDSDKIPHPQLEVVFTAAEEIGMIGARHFDMAQLQGRNMINLDAGGFTEGRICAGCAGSDKFQLMQTLRLREIFPKEGSRMVRICIAGLVGGHSGGDIDKGRGNASVLLGRLLRNMLQGCPEAELLRWQCGDPKSTVKHTIPAAAQAVFLCGEHSPVEDIVKAFQAEVAEELRGVDDGARVWMQVLESDGWEESIDSQSAEGESAAWRRTESENAGGQAGVVAIEHSCAQDIADILLLLPCGVLAWHPDFAGTPRLSVNVGNVEQHGDRLLYFVSARSETEAGLDQVEAKLRTLSRLKHLSLEMEERIPGWSYDPDSRLQALVGGLYKELYGKAPRFLITHASTECGMFRRELAGLDIVSLGPIIYEEHTVREYMELASVGEVWRFLQLLLLRMKEVQP